MGFLVSFNMKDVLKLAVNSPMNNFVVLRLMSLPWIVWLSWLDIVPHTESLLVQLLVRGHAGVGGLTPSRGFTGGS